MEVLNEIFPIILYFLGSIFLAVLIILIVKLIATVDKANEMLDDINKKMKTFDGVFNALDTVNEKLSSFGNKVVDVVLSVVSKITNKKKKGKEDDYE